MKKTLILIVLLGLTSFPLSAQRLTISAEIRPRYENRHGYKSLQMPDTDGANFISQRSRLNFKYSNTKLHMKFSLQNVRTWGDVSTLSSSDSQSNLHEAWAEVFLSDNLSLKMGRQEIVYDDHRIFGSVGWAQQARSHDAFLIKFKPARLHHINVGLALNADGQTNQDEFYSGAAGYKAMQYLWYNGKFDNLGLSFLLLNTGKEYLNENEEQKIDYSQTVGPRITYKTDRFHLDGALYYQMGKQQNTDVNALYFGGNLGYKINEKFVVKLGYEHLSGKDMDDTNVEINTFSPLFGTNHKFNGWMDYFYVGYANPTGLNDLYGTFLYKNGKFKAKLMPHIFSSAAKIINTNNEEMANSLGTEIDFTMGYSLTNNVNLSVGYSKMLGTETLEVLKGGDKDENSSWGWIMFTFKPKLFTHSKP